MKFWFDGVNEILTVQVKKTEGTDDPKTNTMSNTFNVDKEDESLFQKENRNQKWEEEASSSTFRLIGQIMSAYHESILKTHSQKDKILKPENLTPNHRFMLLKKKTFFNKDWLFYNLTKQNPYNLAPKT